MNDGFSAFRAMAIGVAIIFAGTAIAPEVANGQFDLLRITKGKGKGKGERAGQRDRPGFRRRRR